MPGEVMSRRFLTRCVWQTKIFANVGFNILDFCMRSPWSRADLIRLYGVTHYLLEELTKLKWNGSTHGGFLFHLLLCAPQESKRWGSIVKSTLALQINPIKSLVLKVVDRVRGNSTVSSLVFIPFRTSFKKISHWGYWLGRDALPQRRCAFVWVGRELVFRHQTCCNRSYGHPIASFPPEPRRSGTFWESDTFFFRKGLWDCSPLLPRPQTKVSERAVA